MKEEFSVKQGDFLNAGKVSSTIKQKLKTIGIANDKLRKIAVSCYEAEINMIIHSYGGTIIFDILDDDLILSFDDVGPGINDIEKALTPGFSTASKEAREFGFGAGMGLPNIVRNSDDYEINSSTEGTRLKLYFKLC